MPKPHPDAPQPNLETAGCTLAALIWGGLGMGILSIGASAVTFFVSAVIGSQRGMLLAGTALVVGGVLCAIGLVSAIGLLATSIGGVARDGFTPGWAIGLVFSALALLVAAFGLTWYFRPSFLQPQPPPPVARSAPRSKPTDDAVALLTDPTSRLRGLTALVDLAKEKREIRPSQAVVAAQVIPFLDDPDPRVRAEACTALSYLGHARSAAERLIAMVEDETDSAIRAEAAWALVGTRHPRTVPVLVATLRALRSRTPPTPTQDPLVKALIEALKRVRDGISQAALARLREDDPGLRDLIPPERRRPNPPRRSRGSSTQYAISASGQRMRVQSVKRGWSCHVRSGVSVSVSELEAKVARLTVRRGPFTFDAVLGSGERLHVSGGIAIVRLLTDRVELKWEREPPKTVALIPPAAPSDLQLPAMSVHRLPDGRVLTVGNVRDVGGVRDKAVTLALFPAGYANDTTSGFDEHPDVGEGATLTGAMGGLEVVQLTPGSGELPGLVVVRVR